MKFNIEPVEKQYGCTGLVFRSYKSTFFDKGKISERKSLNLLKRKSCGCSECSFILEELSNFDFSCTYSWLNEIEEGELYTLKPSYESDFDCYEGSRSGFSYLSDFKFVKIKR